MQSHHLFIRANSEIRVTVDIVLVVNLRIHVGESVDIVISSESLSSQNRTETRSSGTKTRIALIITKMRRPMEEAA